MTNKTHATMLYFDGRQYNELGLRDPNKEHQMIYGCFTREQMECSRVNPQKRILWKYEGLDSNWQHQYLILSNSELPKLPNQGSHKTVKLPDKFLEYEHYNFWIKVDRHVGEKGSPNKRFLRIEEFEDWWNSRIEEAGFETKALSWSADETKEVKKSDECKFLVSPMMVEGRLSVTHRDKFIKTFNSGIGRAKAYGLGLLKIKPIIKI